MHDYRDKTIMGGKNRREWIDVQGRIYLKILNLKHLPVYLCIFIALNSVISILTGNKNWFSASGAVVAIIGLLLLVKEPTIEQAIDIEGAAKARYSKAFGFAEKDPDGKIKNERIRKAKHALKTEITGVNLTILGTLVWAYGFLLPTYESITCT